VNPEARNGAAGGPDLVLVVLDEDGRPQLVLTPETTDGVAAASSLAADERRPSDMERVP
jgi:hypothetical protein